MPVVPRRRWWLPLLVAALIASSCTDDPAPETSVEVPETTPLVRGPGFDGSRFALIVLVDLSGPDRAHGREVVAGVETYWAAVNASGGVAGRFPVALDVVDHGGDPALAASELTARAADVTMVAALGGADVATAVAELLDGEQILAVAVDARQGLAAAPALVTVGTVEEISVAAGLQSSASLGATAPCSIEDGSGWGTLTADARAVSAAAVNAFILGADTDVNGAWAQALAAGCDLVWLGVAPEGVAAAVAGLEAASADGSTAGVRLAAPASLWWRAPVAAPDGSVVAVDAPPWEADAGDGMAELVVALAGHTPDLGPSAPARRGYTLQLAVRELLERRVDDGNVSRGAIWDDWAAMPAADLRGLASPPVEVDGERVAPTATRLYEVGGADPDGLGWSEVAAVELSG